MTRSLNLSESFLGCSSGSPLQRLVIQPPALDGFSLERPRLVDMMRDGLKTKRILYLVAPAGYGKTTLLSAYAKQEERVAWVNCQRIDGDVISFWLHVATSLHLGAGLSMGHARVLQETEDDIGIVRLLDAIASDITDEGEQVIIILNGFDAISSQEIRDSVSLFLEILDPVAKMVIADRSAWHLPDLALSQRNSLFVLDKNDLALSRAESDACLDLLGYNAFDDAQREALYQRSEGWIWGLRLAASLADTNPESQVGELARRPSADFLGEQLVSEILRPFPHEVRDFMISTSYLRSLYPELCAVMTETSVEEATEYLSSFSNQNLFVVLQENGTLRYHRLFAEALQQIARKTMDGGLRHAWGRGVSWLESRGLLLEAAWLLLDTGQTDGCARFISNHYMELLQHSDVSALTALIDKIPEKSYSADTNFLILKAWTLSFSRRKSVSEYILKKVERLAEMEDRTEYVKDDILCVRLMLALSNNDAEELFEILAPVPDSGEIDNPFRRGIVDIAHGLALALSESLQKAQEMLKGVIQSDAGTFLQLLARVYLGQVLFRLGNFREAQQVLEQAVDLSQNPEESLGFAVVLAYMGLSCIRYEFDDLDDAELYANRCLEAGKLWWLPEAMGNSHNVLGHVYAARGNQDKALEEFVKGAELESRKYFHPFVSHFALRYLKALISSGSLKEPVAWANSLYSLLIDEGETRQLDRNSSHMIETVVDMLYAQGNYKHAAQVADVLIALESTRECRNEYACLLVTKALSLFELRDTNGANAAIREALEIGREEGYQRMFIDEGEPMYRLLDRIYTPKVDDAYLRGILTRILETPAFDTRKRPRLSLSRREMDILRLAAKGLYSKEIARELGISTETVKTHFKNINRKLNTQNRMEAVGKAVQLGLI